MSGDRLGDRGQAFPIYAVVVVGLLFAAFAFFAVAQAAVTRSDAQGAADAAALAAAKDARDHLAAGLVLADLQPEDWAEVLNGRLFDPGGACGKASSFAEQNGAKASSCTVSDLRFMVVVETRRSVGISVVPGTDVQHAIADATAVIEPRCHLGRSSLPAEGSAPGRGPVNIACKGGKEISFDPSKPDQWRVLGTDLFDVRLTD
ncbi:pilus assembly protein TadG-related protein [Streptomyces sp. NPDC051578]|uniref:pilus assembly protein TadG-related protein n=1 Tax=Streptomyces sp. NPDC051578 TaxID=3365662 RepID=UPI0037BD5672